jgi:hypothetical protein
MGFLDRLLGRENRDAAVSAAGTMHGHAVDVRSAVVKILAAFQDADTALQAGQDSAAWPKYTEAMELLMALPDSEPFDRLAFGASCIAGMAVANLRTETTKRPSKLRTRRSPSSIRRPRPLCRS